MTGGGRRTARSRIKSGPDSGDGDPSQNARPPLRRHRDRSKSGGGFLRILNVNLKYVLGAGAGAFVVIFFMVNHLVKPAEEAKWARVVTLFPAPKIMDLPQFQGEHGESLYWGTYRPHIYLGIRARALVLCFEDELGRPSSFSAAMEEVA